MTPSTSQNEGLRRRLRQRWNLLRHRPHNHLGTGSIHSSRSTQDDPMLATNAAPISQDTTPSIVSLASTQANHIPSEESINTCDDEAEQQTDQLALHTDHVHQILTADRSTVGDDADNSLVSPDLWSAAYREAVASLGEDIDIAILKGENVAQLFRDLEEIDMEATQESAFLRGVKYLQSIQVPLERFKLALDLASPLTSIEPTASTVFGVVRSVTAIAISFATADLEFAKQIAEMLEQISYIDDCDTLGQKSDKQDIHKALVSVYQKLLEFYKAGFEILTKRGAKLVVKLVLENDRLPNIVQDFLRHAETLRKLVQKATWEIVVDIQAMLYDQETSVSRWLSSAKMKQQSQYHAYLRDLRADEACEFLLTNAEFINWYQASDSQQLVVLGDMGYGKTVTMAFLADELSRRNEYQLPQPKVCYYYCRGDETGHAIQILSGLILSLLKKLPGLNKTFFGWYKQAQASEDLEPATNIKKLEEFLQKVLAAIDRPVFFVIDGLDECDKASRNILLSVLKSLSQNVPSFKSVLSSRPQEEILEQMHEMVKIDLGSNVKRDEIIAQKTADRHLIHLSKHVKAFLVESLSRSAQGSAIWTKMVIGLIEVEGITTLGPMRLFLEEIPLPEKLSTLYATLFSRCTSDYPKNQELASTALKLLAIARRPLSILELAWAVALDHPRVMKFIQPFVTRVDFSDVKKRQVRLIHQLVKDFIIRELMSNRPCLRTPTISMAAEQPLVHQSIESLEALILDISIRYLRLDDIGASDIFSDEQLAIEALPQNVELFDSGDKTPDEYHPSSSWEVWEESMIRYDPTERGFGEFFVYASCH
ncbi:hypothetical protein G7046_g1687 [Stylonectria norvegica]|nr:hypothetical protein G7046_g1687 [Stylonectria norvegica]